MNGIRGLEKGKSSHMGGFRVLGQLTRAVWYVIIREGPQLVH